MVSGMKQNVQSVFFELCQTDHGHKTLNPLFFELWVKNRFCLSWQARNRFFAIYLKI